MGLGILAFQSSSARGSYSQNSVHENLVPNFFYSCYIILFAEHSVSCFNIYQVQQKMHWWLLEMDASGKYNSCILNYALVSCKVSNHKKPLELQYHWAKGDAPKATLYQLLHKQPETVFIILCHLILHCIVLKGNLWKVIFQRSNFWHSKYIFDVYHQKYFILCLGMLNLVNYLRKSKETVNFRIPVLLWTAPHSEMACCLH